MADITGMLQAAAGNTGSPEPPNPNAWDLTKAYYDAGASAYSLSGGVEIAGGVEFSVAAQETGPTGLRFKPDGTKMYVIGTSGDDINEYSLSTPWTITSASFVSNYSVADSSPTDLQFKPDGTKVYVLGASQDRIFEYDLSTPWDLSTMSLLQSLLISGEETSPEAFSFNDDGTKMYLTGTSGDDTNEYDLSTAWDISTATYSQLYDQNINTYGLFFKPDGTSFYINGATTAYRYALSTPWDISTASQADSRVTTDVDGTLARAIVYDKYGSTFCVIGNSTDTIFQYVVNPLAETNAQSVFFKPDGTKYYVISSTGDLVRQYDLSTAWDIRSRTDIQTFSLGSQDTAPQGLWFKTDGTKMFVTGGTNDRVYEYSLSTAWDISSASYVRFTSLAGQDVIPWGLFFTSDGLSMYMTGDSGNSVYQYSLSSAWDTSTLSYVRSFSVSSQASNPRQAVFKDDGTVMYVIDGDFTIFVYNLSTAWDISSATYDYSINVYASGSTGIYIRPNGEQFFVVSAGSDRILSYLISEE